MQWNWLPWQVEDAAHLFVDWGGLGGAGWLKGKIVAVVVFLGVLMAILMKLRSVLIEKILWYILGYGT